jgi:hypothetical protein
MSSLHLQAAAAAKQQQRLGRKDVPKDSSSRNNSSTPPAVPMQGVLELGGGSLQVTFLPTIPPPSSEACPLDLPSLGPGRLYSRSFDGLGLQVCVGGGGWAGGVGEAAIVHLTDWCSCNRCFRTSGTEAQIAQGPRQCANQCMSHPQSYIAHSCPPPVPSCGHVRPYTHALSCVTAPMHRQPCPSGPHTWHQGSRAMTPANTQASQQQQPAAAAVLVCMAVVTGVPARLAWCHCCPRAHPVPLPHVDWQAHSCRLHKVSCHYVGREVGCICGAQA